MDDTNKTNDQVQTDSTQTDPTQSTPTDTSMATDNTTAPAGEVQTPTEPVESPMPTTPVADPTATETPAETGAAMPQVPTEAENTDGSDGSSTA